MAGFLNQFPYSDFHELNIDWLLNKTKELEVTTNYLLEEWSKITILTEEYIEQMINTAIETNNIVLYNRMIQLKNEAVSEAKTYCNNQINNLQTYVDTQDTYYNGLAQSYADHAESESKAYTDNQVLNYTMMVNPITGQYEDVRLVVDDIVSYFHTENALTAGEYDALELTAEDYDAYELTAYDYDFNGKIRLT